MTKRIVRDPADYTERRSRIPTIQKQYARPSSKPVVHAARYNWGLWDTLCGYEFERGQTEASYGEVDCKYCVRIAGGGTRNKKD